MTHIIYCLRILSDRIPTKRSESKKRNTVRDFSVKVVVGGWQGEAQGPVDKNGDQAEQRKELVTKHLKKLLQKRQTKYQVNAI